MNFLYKMWLLWQSPRLGSDAFYPLPNWLKSYLSKYHLYERVGLYARLLDGVDMSVITPDEVGCVESMTRLLRNLDPSLTDVLTYTPYFVNHMEGSKRFIEVEETVAKLIGIGVIVIAETGTGNNKVSNGHVGVLDGDRIWSNHSYGKDWSGYWSLLTFKNYYQLKGGMKVRYFLPI